VRTRAAETVAAARRERRVVLRANGMEILWKRC
jgi:hypothetical protein